MRRWQTCSCQSSKHAEWIQGRRAYPQRREAPYPQSSASKGPALASLNDPASIHPSRKDFRRVFIPSKSSVSHSQTTSSRQPCASRADSVSRSCATFRACFSVQYAVFVTGFRRPFTQSWACQKQPCTKIPRLPGSTMSGSPTPGLQSKRSPRRRRAARTARSGFVPWERISRMFSRRSSAVRPSTKST